MSELTLKLIILLIPGALATLIFGKLILHQDWSPFRFLLYATLFGVFSYLLLQLFSDFSNSFTCNRASALSIWDSLSDASIIPYKEVAYASFLAIFLALGVTFFENRKILSRIAHWLNISNKFGEENLFSKFLNDPTVEYVYVRDIKNNLTYYGWIKSFSETETISEILIADVSVYRYKSSKLLYEVDEVYLSLGKTDIIIELAISN
ncbi:hypothetical protein [Owenweeksia hongkongensis]|uniref:hypothetical protein n=1 Tax=Owenweeksia hongkongensis TaxID=253245 RepID=UPI003A8F48ED